MRSFVSALIAVLVAVPGAGRAAELTTVLSSFQGEDEPFHVTLGLAFLQQQQRATITKEYQEGNGITSAHVVDAKELSYLEVKRSLEVTARMGLSKNLEMSVVLPVVLSWDVSWDLAGGTALQQSVINSNDFGTGVCPRPVQVNKEDPSKTSGWTYSQANNTCTPVNATQKALGNNAANLFAPLFAVSGLARFSGIADPRFGLTWGMLDQRDDPSVPTWTLGVDYTAPVAGVRDPINAARLTAGTSAAGTGFHVLGFSTGLSRRFRVAEPYAQLRYVVSFPGGDAFDACNHPEILATPENCPGLSTTTGWTNAMTRAKPAQLGSVLFGSEFQLVRGGEQRLFADLGGLLEYHSEGRDYTQATFMLGKLTYQEQFARIGGRMGIGYAPSPLVTFLLGGSYSLDTAHVLTGEMIGEDTYPDGSPDGQVGLNNKGQEINPNFDFRYDMPGHRLRATQISTWSLSLGGALNF